MLQCLEYCSKSGNISVADIHKFKTENFDGSMLEISHPQMSLNDMGGYHAFKNMFPHYLNSIPMKLNNSELRNLKALLLSVFLVVLKLYLQALLHLH